MWKRDESVRPAAGQPAAPPQPAVQAPPAGSAPRQEAGHNMEKDIVNIGKSVVIKGELNGSGSHHRRPGRRDDSADHILTIGPNGRIKAQVSPSQ
jgi:hypothetical protein